MFVPVCRAPLEKFQRQICQVGLWSWESCGAPLDLLGSDEMVPFQRVLLILYNFSIKLVIIFSSSMKLQPLLWHKNRYNESISKLATTNQTHALGAFYANAATVET